MLELTIGEEAGTCTRSHYLGRPLELLRAVVSVSVDAFPAAAGKA